MYDIPFGCGSGEGFWRKGRTSASGMLCHLHPLDLLVSVHCESYLAVSPSVGFRGDKRGDI